MNIKYKIATTEDLIVIEELARVIWNEHYITIITQEQIDYMLKEMYSYNSLKKQMQEEHCEFTLVYLNDKPVGYISVMAENKEGEYFLPKFYIHKDARGIKLGEQLFNEVMNRLKGIKLIRLFVNRLNYKTINFYFKVGFTIEKVIDQDIGKGFYMNDYVMIKHFN